MGAGHHFLPRFYLDGFTDPDPPRGHTPFLWIYNFDEGRWRRRSPANAAKKTDLYTSTTMWGQRHDLLEQSLSLLETMAAPILRKKIPNCQPFSEEDRWNFAGFVAQMVARTPAAMDLLAEVYKSLTVARLKLRVERWKEDPEEWESFKKEFNAARPETPMPEGLRPEDIYPDPNRFKIEVPSQEMAGWSLASSWGMLPLLLEMGWAFFRTEAPLYFITSDNPCARVEFGPAGPAPGGLAAERVQLTLPISRTECFMAGWKWNGITWRLATRDLVAEMNKRTAHFGKTFIVGPKPGFPGAGEIIASRQRKAETPTEPDC